MAEQPTVPDQADLLIPLQHQPTGDAPASPVSNPPEQTNASVATGDDTEACEDNDANTETGGNRKAETGEENPRMPAKAGEVAMRAANTTVLAEWNQVQIIEEVYRDNYRALVRLAWLLVRDIGTAEEVVQDCFIELDTAYRRLRDESKVLSYLRQSVVNKSRSVRRHRVVVDKNAPKPPPDVSSAEDDAIGLLERSAVIAALRGLPRRQREALVLRFYADLSEAAIATAMGISRGAVKSHTARGVAKLRQVLKQEVSF